MKVSDILTEYLKDKKVLVENVEYYDSLVCLTKYSRDEVVKIERVSLEENDACARGIIVGGELDGTECNFPISEETDFKFLD